MALRTSRVSIPDHASAAADHLSAAAPPAASPSSVLSAERAPAGGRRVRRGPGSRPSGRAGVRPGARPGRSGSARGRAALAAAAARRRADALMAGGPGAGVAAEPSPGSAPESGPGGVPESGPRTYPLSDDRAGEGVQGQAAGPSQVGRLVSGLWDRVPLWVRIRWGLAPRTLAALALVLVAAVGLAAFHFWSVRPQGVRAPETVEAGAAAVAGDPLRAGGADPVPRPVAGAPPSPPPEPAGEIVVDVSGKVHRPGVQRLPAGSRVADALRAAGGVRAGTDVTGLNRARVLMDGEQVAVGLPQAPAALGATGGAAGAPGTAGPAAPLSLSVATKEQLETLPGVGPVLAQHIIDHRTENGGFRFVDELRQVNGIGDRRFADLRPLVQP
ncbi:helix-hairpin-helix domain-containing protein [Streptomyces cyaneofuscatus]|uniref:helix-hairpin-helix domain-containing protein n=1 Tax=Streptomyces cyaneofuscatus TaxID=66883 RepID=UPI003F4DE357